MKYLVVFLLFFIQTSCAYRLGFADRELPEAIDKIAVPVFKNTTMEVGIETFFANEMVRQFEISGVAAVTSRKNAEAIVLGTINKITYLASTQDRDLAFLPLNSVLTTEYRIMISASIELVRAKDGQKLWTGKVNEERVYQAPQITSDTVNSANPLYNRSVRLDNIQLMARDMMVEAFERMTENF